MSDCYHDTQGNLQPPEIHQCTPDQLRQKYVEAFPDSKRRSPIYGGWQKYVSEFASDVSPEFQQWIGGSFITKKADPDDIDVVNLVPPEAYTAAVNQFDESNGSKEKFMVDGRTLPVYPEGSPGYQLGQWKIAHWLKFFTHDRQGNEKGILGMEFSDGNP